MKRRKNSLRYANYNYSALGAYFVTICSHKSKNLFGLINNNEIQLSNIGNIVLQILEEITSIREIELDEYIIMPNHIHAIIRIVGVIHESSKENPSQIITLSNKRAIRELPLQIEEICCFQKLLVNSK